MASFRIIFIIFALGALESCISIGTLDRESSATETPSGSFSSGQQTPGGVLSTALGLQGQKPEARVIIGGKNFTLDCIGTVAASYWGNEVDITQDFKYFDGNGVSRLYHALVARNAMSKKLDPQPGDIVFWENTWDRNGDGKVGNDGPTHAGLVISIDTDGTTHYLHEDYISGVVQAVMNLKRPGVYKDEEGKILNTPLYMGSYYGNKKNPPRYLSGDLWLGFGPILDVVTLWGKNS